MGDGVLPDLRVLIIGAGWAGQSHACTAARSAVGATVVGVVDPDPSRAASLAAEHDASSYSTVEVAIDGCRPDAAIVASPPGAHAAAVVTTVTAGIATFLEKPLARSMVDGLAILRAAQQPCAPVTAVGYQWRTVIRDMTREFPHLYAPERVVALVSTGVAPTQTRPWFADDSYSAGLLSERASHHVNLQQAFAGPVAAVAASRGSNPTTGARRGNGEPDDSLVVSLRFTSGAVGSVVVVSVVADAAVAHSLRIVSASDVTDIDLDPAFSLHAFGGPAGPRNHSMRPFEAEIDDFLLAVRENDPTRVACSVQAAFCTLRVIEAAERSLGTGQWESVNSGEESNR